MSDNANLPKKPGTVELTILYLCAKSSLLNERMARLNVDKCNFEQKQFFVTRKQLWEKACNVRKSVKLIKLTLCANVGQKSGQLTNKYKARNYAENNHVCKVQSWIKNENSSSRGLQVLWDESWIMRSLKKPNFLLVLDRYEMKFSPKNSHKWILI